MSNNGNNPDVTKIVKTYLEAYQTKDRRLLEDLLHTGFTFTSPADDHISRDAYFARCWPFSELNPVYHFVNFTQNDNTVFVLYECVTKDNKQFRNVECVHFAGDKIITIEVFFGRPL